MQSSLILLRNQLATDSDYFKKVYTYTFDFARSEGQRSLGQGQFWCLWFRVTDWVSTTIGLDTAQEFWNLLLPHGLSGGALTGRSADDVIGWQEKYNRWWSEFLTQKGSKGVSKDTWTMVSISSRVSSSQLQMSNHRIPSSSTLCARSTPSSQIMISKVRIPIYNDNEAEKQGCSFVVALQGAWPSVIDDFVEYAKTRLDSDSSWGNLL